VKAHRVVRRRGSHIFLDNRLTDGDKVVSLTRRPHFTPQKECYRKDYNNGSDQSLLQDTEEKHEDAQVLLVSASVCDLGNSGIQVSRWS
jgi:hypothetical protein